MARVTPIINSFTGGELSPKMFGRTDLEIYKKGLADSLNMLVWSYGGITRRQGSYYVTSTKTQAEESRLIKFRQSTDQAYVLEFGKEYIRFYMDGGQILSGATAYEIATPYAATELGDIQVAQSADTMYITHPSYKTRKLTRSGHTSWTLVEAPFVWEPFLDTNTTTTTITPSAVTGSGVTLTSSTSGVFSSGHVGSFWAIKGNRKTEDSLASVTSGTAETIEDGESLICSLNGTWVGILILQRSYDEGTTWLDYAAYTVNTAFEIVGLDETIQYRWNMSAYTSGTAVVALSKPDSPGYVEVESNVYETAEYASGSTLTFTSGSIIDSASGFITAGFTSGDVTVSGATTSGNDGVFGCTLVTADVLTFASGSFTAEVGVSGTTLSETLATIDTTQVNCTVIEELPSTDATIKWAEGAWSEVQGYPQAITFFEQRLVFAGTTGRPQRVWASESGDFESFKGGTNDSDAWNFTIASNEVNTIEWILSGEKLFLGSAGGIWVVGSSGGAVTATNIEVNQQTIEGTTSIQPIKIGKSVIYIQDKGKKVLAMTYSFEKDAYQAVEISKVAEHLFADGITAMAYQAQPEPYIWWVVGGNLVSCAYDQLNKVNAYTYHEITGTVESIAVIPGDDRDELWMIANRTINSGTTRYVEQFQTSDWGDVEDSIFMDSALTYSGAATTTLSGFSHLEGETVSILADGSAHPTAVVTSGLVTLERSATKAQVGLGYLSWIKTLRLESGAQAGTSQSKRKNIFKVNARFHKTLGAKLGYSLSKLDPFLFRDADDPMDSAPPLFSGDKELPFNQGSNRDGQMYIVQEQPLPFSILAIMPTVYTSDF